MTAEGKKIAVGVFCADWRLHQEGVHVNNAVKKHLGVDGVDVIAIPGPDGVCAIEQYDIERGLLAKWLKLLVGAHKPVAIAFIAHYNCAGHPVNDTEHDQHAEEMMQYYKKELGFKGDLVALCATYKSDTEWPLKEVGRIPAEA